MIIYVTGALNKVLDLSIARVVYSVLNDLKKIFSKIFFVGSIPRKGRTIPILDISHHIDNIEKGFINASIKLKKNEQDKLAGVNSNDLTESESKSIELYIKTLKELVKTYQEIISSYLLYYSILEPTVLRSFVSNDEQIYEDIDEDSLFKVMDVLVPITNGSLLIWIILKRILQRGFLMMTDSNKK